MAVNKFMKRFFLVILAALIISPLFLIKQGQTKTQAYYSGDAVNYRGQIIVATANTGYLEVFEVQGQQLERILKVKIYNGAYNTYDDYADVKLTVENNNLYVYAISGFTVYKYNFSDLAHLSLTTSAKNTYWNWYYRLDKYGDNLGLVTKTGVDLIDSNLQNIVSVPFAPEDKYSLRGSDNQFLLGLNAGHLQIYDRNQQSIIKEIPLNFSSTETNRKAYFNTADQTVYTIDDYYMKKFSAGGQLLATFRHLDATGYDAESSADDTNVYFSNGLGVVSLRKSDLKLQNYAYTTTLAGPQGWAMGLKLLNTDQGDILVIFNASNILVLDKNLHKIAAATAVEEAESQTTEALFLNADHNFGVPGAAINLSGGGYWPSEKINITLGSVLATSATTDRQGRFITKLTIPSLSVQNLDLKVTGVDSGLSYSTSFKVQ
jgi:hypothetical protein